MSKSTRIVGLDVARSLAILGMVLVNFRGKVHPEIEGFTRLAWILDRMEGKWAAVFVVLAGVGIGLQAKAAKTALQRTHLRRSLLIRSAALLLLGVLHQHWWTWDILVFYGVYIALSILFLYAPSYVLWASIVAMLFGCGWQWMHHVRPQLDFWTLRGATGKLLMWGNHPVLPWFSLVLFGLWLSRLDLRSSRVRIRLLIIALLVLAGSELANLYVRAGGNLGSDPPILDMLRTWPRPTRPGFVVSGMAFATVAIMASIELALGREERGLIPAMRASGQLALTLYVAHVPAVLVPLAHGWNPTGLVGLMTYGLAFYAVGLTGSLWWRRRFERGPLEGLLTAITRAPSPTADGSLLTAPPRS